MEQIILRDYQKEACQDIWASLQAGENALLSAPCSFGKSITLATIINKLIVTVPTARVLILVDREILVRQLANTIKQVCGIDPGIGCGSVSIKHDFDRQITVATRQTIINHLDNFEPVNLCIIDEVHVCPVPPADSPNQSQFGKILSRLFDYNHNMRLLGVTATPYRLAQGFIYGNKHKEGLKPYFKSMSHAVTYDEMTRGGWIAPLKGVISDFTIDTSNVAMVGREFNIGQLSDTCILHVDTVRQAAEKYATGHKHIIVFAVDIAHVEAICSVLPGSVPYHSKLSSVEQQSAMSGYKQGKYKFLVSIGKLTTGFDHPPTSCCIMARPTMSPSLFVQMVGRILRKHDGKEAGLLIDLTDNSKVHLIDFDLDRPVVIVPISMGGEGDAPYKLCPGNDGTCLAELHPKTIKCPECGYIFEKLQAEDLGKMKAVDFHAFEPKPPEWKKAEWIEPAIHEAKSGKKLLKVTIKLETDALADYTMGFNKLGQVVDWICLPPDYDGYALEKGTEKFLSYLPEGYEFPKYDDLQLYVWDALSDFIQPVKVKVQENARGYYELLDMKFEGEMFEDFEGTGEDVPF